jgi:hypothetical protein
MFEKVFPRPDGTATPVRLGRAGCNGERKSAGKRMVSERDAASEVAGGSRT